MNIRITKKATIVEYLILSKQFPKGLITNSIKMFDKAFSCCFLKRQVVYLVD